MMHRKDQKHCCVTDNSKALGNTKRSAIITAKCLTIHTKHPSKTKIMVDKSLYLYYVIFCFGA